MPEEPKPKEGEEPKPDPVMDVLTDLKKKVEELHKPLEEKPTEPTVPTWVQEREDEKKALGFTEEQMQAHERSIARQQAPLMQQTAWISIEKKSDIAKYREKMKEELKIYPPERQNPELIEKVYYMVKGRDADSAPAAPAASKPGERVASTRVSGGPGYSGTEGGGSTETQKEDKTEQLNEAEVLTAKKLGVDEKRFALSRNSGRDITPLKKPDERPAQTGADLELKRLQGVRR